ncbi:alkaline phosphatase family protein [Patescibacteria group bacterium]|nr:alkaline phosphatase family protein [Patescibacteria group bacterium]
MKKYFLLFASVFIGFCAFWFYKNNSSRFLKLPSTWQISGGKGVFSGKIMGNSFDHIAVIVMENKSFKDIVGNRSAPYINSLIPEYSLLGNYHAVAHPSLPNYIALVGGSTFGIESDCTDCFIKGNNLANQLEQYHKTWKAYMESMPSICFIGGSGLYVQKHNPFIYFNDIRNNKERCDNIVPFSKLESDLKSNVPNFIFISPNLCNDMHECSTAIGDKWLSVQIPMILNSSAFNKQKSLLILTWDEDDGLEDNKVAAIFIGSGIKKGYVSQIYYTHYSLLHTIENLWGLSPLTENVSQSAVISDVF